MITRIATRLAAATALLGLSMTAHAISQAPAIYVLPSSAEISLSEGTATLELFMEFTDTPTVGGGIDLTATGAVSLLEFIPSNYFNGIADPLNPTPLPDPAFTGFGTALADGDLEIHFGNFTGLSGLNKLGDLVLSLDSVGPGNLNIGINTFFGVFFSTSGSEQDVFLSGASLQVVPVPAAAWLFLSAVGGLAGLRLRRAA
jgi:hypothetical protein